MQSQIETEFSLFQDQIDLKDEKINLSSVNQIVHHINSLIKILQKIVYLIEYFDINYIRTYGSSISSSNKLTLALILAGELVKFPFFLSFISNPILKIIISIVVQMLNQYNQGWDHKLSLIKSPRELS